MIFIQLSDENYLDLIDNLTVAYNELGFMIVREENEEKKSDLIAEQHKLQELLEIIGEQGSSQLTENARCKLD